MENINEIDEERLKIRGQIQQLKDTIIQCEEREGQLKDVVANNPHMLPSSRMINYVDFESSTGDTDQQRTFRRLFQADMRKILKGKITRIELNRNHFEMYGFFETTTGKIFYINTGDLRWSAKQMGMLIRTAKDFRDFTGGPNMTVMYDENFADSLLKIIN